MISEYICLSGLGNGLLVSKNRVEKLQLKNWSGKGQGFQSPCDKKNSYSTLP